MSEKVIDNETLAVSGGTATATKDIGYQEGVLLCVEGDSNATDVDIAVRVKQAAQTVFCNLFEQNKQNVDLTGGVGGGGNNTASYQFDVSGADEIEVVIVNNSGTNSPVVTAYVQEYETHQ